MKTIGLIGGMSSESTAIYYRILNATITEALGGLHSAKCILYSLDLAEVEAYQAKGDWVGAARLMVKVGRTLHKAGAELLLICANTMHKVAPEVQRFVPIPLLHIADVAAQAVVEQGLSRVALLGTSITLEQDFYIRRLLDRGVRAVTPGPDDRALLDRIIYGELCQGKALPESREALLALLGRMSDQGVKGVLLGCTELGMLLRQSDLTLPVFDTAYLHAREAALLALKG